MQRLSSVFKCVVSCVALATVLAGCAISPSASSSRAASGDVLQELNAGTLRLQCETTCFVHWRSQSRHLKSLHDNRVWADLAHEVAKTDYSSDLSYYYLGRAAEGLGHPEAAVIYYRLALSQLHRCEGWLSDCDGFDFPRDIRVRMVSLPASKNQVAPVANKVSPGVPASAPAMPPVMRPRQRTGTGFFINAQGLMVTNWHVVENAHSIAVTTAGQPARAAQLLAKDPACDLAILKTASGAPFWLPIQRSAKKVKRGSEVLTVGFPRVNLQGVESKVTNGLISSLTGVANDPKFFQISVPIQPGNSGGPLVSRDGMVVGVVSGKLATTSSGNDAVQLAPENVNYAVKSSCLLDLLRTLPSKQRYDTKPLKTSKAGKKAKGKNQSKELSMVDLTERVEKTVGLVTATVDAQ